MSTGVPGSPGGQSLPGSFGPQGAPSGPIDFATHASQVAAQTSLGDIDTSTASGTTHLANLDTNIGTHTAAIDTSTAHLPTIDTSTATLAAAIGLTKFECQYVSIPHNADNTITFVLGKAARIRVSNYSTTALLLVKQSAISSSSDTAAARVPAATSATAPGVFDFVAWGQATVHLWSGDAAGTVNVSVEGFA